MSEIATGEPEAPGKNSPGREENIPPIPEFIDLNEFQKQGLVELYQLGSDLGLRVGGSRSKHQLVFEILQFYGKKGSRIEACGILEPTKEGFGFLRWEGVSFAPFQDSVYVSPSLIRQNGLRPGNQVKVVLRSPREREKYLSSEAVVAVEGIPIEDWESRTHFDKLTALSPRERIILENSESNSVGARVVDLIAPLGKGQRGLICAPPRGGKTILLKDIATSIRKNARCPTAR